MTSADEAKLQLEHGCKSLVARKLIDEFLLLESTGSTNSDAMRRIHKKDTHRTLIVAVEQTHGRGRTSNRWHSGLGALTMSLIVPLSNQPDAVDIIPTASLRVGAGICSELETHFDHYETCTPDWKLKWPNDLYVNAAKLGGILIECHSSAPQTLVVGVGLNVNNVLPAHNLISHAAISLAELTGTTWPLEVPLNLIVNGIVKSLTADFHWFDAYLSKCLLTGQQITLMQNDCLISGRCEGITAQGHILINSGTTLSSYQSGNLVKWGI